jgi:hypothetical protein
LNQNVVLQQIGFDGKTGTPWEKLFKVSTGNIIITALGFVPGEPKSGDSQWGFNFQRLLCVYFAHRNARPQVDPDPRVHHGRVILLVHPRSFGKPAAQ